MLMKSSVARKYAMGITGHLFCAFLVMHLAGNLLLIAGPGLFNEYAARLHSLGILIYLAEAGLIAVFLLHLVTAIQLTFQNRAARPRGYKMDNSGGRTKWASSTMIFSGLVILIFLVVHISTFKYGQRPIVEVNGVAEASLYHLVLSYFQNPLWVAFYVFCILVLSLHLSHGFQSAFQSLGISHPRYNPWIKSLSYLYTLAMAVGYTVLPLYLHLGTGGVR